MKSFLKSAVVAAVAVMALSAQAVVIDDFSLPTGALDDASTNLSGLWAQTNGPAANILGGQRDIYVTKTFNPADDGDGARIRAQVSGDRYRFSSDSGQSGFGIIRWDGVNALPADASNAGAGGTINATGLGGTNLTLGGALGFLVTVNNADLGFKFTMEAYTNAANYATVTLDSFGPGLYFIPFAVFSLIDPDVVIVGGGVNFTNVGALQVIVNSGATPVEDVDFQIEIASTTLPEPATLGLVGATLLGLGFMRRRRAAK